MPIPLMTSFCAVIVISSVSIACYKYGVRASISNFLIISSSLNDMLSRSQYPQALTHDERSSQESRHHTSQKHLPQVTTTTAHEMNSLTTNTTKCRPHSSFIPRPFPYTSTKHFPDAILPSQTSKPHQTRKAYPTRCPLSLAGPPLTTPI
jgi:hypothetical protein